MGGVEYASMNGHDSWTAMLGLRIFWNGERNDLFMTGRKPFDS